MAGSAFALYVIPAYNHERSSQMFKKTTREINAIKSISFLLLTWTWFSMVASGCGSSSLKQEETVPWGSFQIDRIHLLETLQKSIKDFSIIGTEIQADYFVTHWKSKKKYVIIVIYDTSYRENLKRMTPGMCLDFSYVKDKNGHRSIPTNIRLGNTEVQEGTEYRIIFGAKPEQIHITEYYHTDLKKETKNLDA